MSDNWPEPLPTLGPLEPTGGYREFRYPHQEPVVAPDDVEPAVISKVDPKYLAYIASDNAAKVSGPKHKAPAYLGYYDPADNPDPNRRGPQFDPLGVDMPTDPTDPTKKERRHARLMNPALLRKTKAPDISTEPPPGLESVYGQVGGKPIHGPISWELFFQDWDQFQMGGSTPGIPTTPGLNHEEREFLKKYGIRIVRALGSGGYGVVFACKWTKYDPWKATWADEEDLACKVLHLGQYRHAYGLLTSPKEAYQALLREQQILSELDHPHLIRYNTMFNIHHELSGYPFAKLLVFMELCDGDLHSYLESPALQRQWGRMFDNEAKEVMRQLCDALYYLHDKYIIHFDIKPLNVLYVKDPATGQLVWKFTDFGLARKFIKKKYRGARASKGGGTPGFKAPEIEKGGKFSAKRADIFSLGRTLAAMLLGLSKWEDFLDDLHISWPLSEQKVYSYTNTWNLTMEAVDLMRQMTHKKNMSRPKIDMVMAHPWFATP